ncbi:VOC family protein [Nonomuraea deserti]|uniref:VOC family protein n=1 Tax=Nonomuraea deserti TaxID=1848322 RepID=A0A4V2YBK4_9ACTN|nr:VOC family protein [Nonomuraea deserti]TDD07976.1 VOC family protein [Nonomuraea deserti]
MEVLSSRILLRPNALERSRRFYAETLGLAVYREFGPPDHPGVVFFLGQGFLELSGSGGDGGDGDDAGAGEGVSLWLQVRDVAAEEERLRRAGVTVLREARTEPWGLIEAWIADPDGHRIVLVQVPPGHPLRRDPR